MPLKSDIKWDEPSKAESVIATDIKWDNMDDKNYVEQQVAQVPSLQGHVTEGLAEGKSYTQIRAQLKDFETERTAETAPWIDPAIAASGGFGAGGKMALSRGATPAGAAIKAFLSGSTAAATEPISGTLTDVIGEKYPKAALPFNLVSSGLLGAGLESPLERVISRTAGRALPKTAAKIAGKAPKVSDIVWDIKPKEVPEAPIVAPERVVAAEIPVEKGVTPTKSHLEFLDEVFDQPVSKGGKVFLEADRQGGTPEVFGFGGDSITTQWTKGKDFTKAEARSAIKSALKNKELSGRGQAILDDIVDASKEDFDTISKKTVDVDFEIAEGQKVVIDDETFTKTVNDKGEVFLEDGKTIGPLAPDSQIRVDKVLPKEGEAPVLKAQDVKLPRVKPTQPDFIGAREGLEGRVPAEEAPIERGGLFDIEGRKQTQAQAEAAKRQVALPGEEAVVSGTLPKIDVQAGHVEVGPMTAMAKKAAKSFKEFWQPLSTVPESDKLLKARSKSLGDLDRIESFTKKIWKRTNKLEPEVKRDMFRYLDGELDVTAIPVHAQGLAKSLRNTMNMTGKMLVRRGLLTEETFQANKSQYTRYLYLKHILGEKNPIKVGQNGAMDLSNLKKRKDLTKEQQRAIGLVEDVSVSAPVGLMQSLTNIAKYDFFNTISENPNWTWQPSKVKIKLPGELRARSMGIGKLAEETKVMREVYEQAPNVPEIKAKYNALSQALDRAMAETANVPEDFVQLPTSKSYGPLAGAFVRKPIARDIMPIYSMNNTGLSRIVDTALQIEAKGMAAFKVAKVALNPPTAFRNVISNIFQLNMSGIPLPMIPVHMTKAMQHILAQTPEYIQAKRNGLFRTNWAQAEIKDVLDTIRPLQNKPHQQVLSGLSKVAEQYGKIDDFFKMAKFLEQLGKGVDVPSSVRQAQKWGMDYSLAHPAIKFARRHIAPFISYQYKVAPLIAESLAKRPWVIGKYLAIPYMMSEMIKDRDDISEKQWERLEKELPLYIKKEKSYMIVPWKSPEGRYQWVNLEYYFPWGNLMGMGRAMYDRDARETLEGLGIGNPFLDIYAAFKGMRGDLPPKDPFTGREIYNELDRPSGKAAKTMEWLYNKWAPSFATRYGALGYASRIGKQDRYGRTTTPGHAIGRVFGFNVVAPSPIQTAKAKKARMLELRFALSRIIKDPEISAEEKNRARTAFTRKINEVME